MVGTPSISGQCAVLQLLLFLLRRPLAQPVSAGFLAPHYSPMFAGALRRGGASLRYEGSYLLKLLLYTCKIRA